MKKNRGIKILTAAIVIVVGIILMNGQHRNVGTNEKKTDPNNLNEAIASQFNDNIRDVASRLQETEKKLSKIEANNQVLTKQNESILKTGVIKQGTPTNIPLFEKEIQQLKEELKQLKSPQESSDNEKPYPITTNNTGIHDIDLLLMKREVNPIETAYWEKLKTKQKPIAKSQKQPTKKLKDIPFYTIPAGSDLGHTTLLSALIGEVPVEGKLMQPLFPFSAIISRGDLMAANGIPLPPEITGMKVNGYAIGVGSFLDNISCVRAYVMSALFVFQDGHFVTVGKDQMRNSAEMINNESLGYLSSPYGSPCIKGTYFTNAPQVLTAMVAAEGIKGLGTALSQWQMTYMATPNGSSATPTGSMGQYALGGGLSQGTGKAAEWLEKHIQGSFDMVFVPASLPLFSHGVKSYRPNQVSFHLTKTINLDKETNGRVLDYGHSQLQTHDFSLK